MMNPGVPGFKLKIKMFNHADLIPFKFPMEEKGMKQNGSKDNFTDLIIDPHDKKAGLGGT